MNHFKVVVQFSGLDIVVIKEQNFLEKWQGKGKEPGGRVIVPSPSSVLWENQNQTRAEKEKAQSLWAANAGNDVMYRK